MTGEQDSYRDWDAAYVLGSLSPDERREFERHMAGCKACRVAVTELAGMPAVLSELSREQALALGGGDDGERSPLAQVAPLAPLAAAAQRARRRRVAWQAAAAVGLVVAGGVGSTALSSLGGSSAAADITQVTLDPVDGSDVSADVVLTPSSWGTQMEWDCSYPAYSGPPPDDLGVYELVLVGDDGTRTVVATWSGDGGDDASGLLASSAIVLDDITRIELGVEGVDVVLAAADLDA